MPLLHRYSTPIFTQVVVVAFTVATALPVHAATPPAPSVTIVNVERGTPVRKADPNAKSTEFPRQGAGNSTISTKITSDRGEATYTISLRNTSNLPVKGLVVEYSFYTITLSTGKNVTGQPEISEVTGAASVDIDPNKTLNLETVPVPYENTQNQYTTTSPVGYNVTPYGPNVNNNGAVVTPDTVKTTMSSTSTTTSTLGWHVELQFNGKVLKSSDVPSDLIDKLKNFYHFKPAAKPVAKPAT